MHMRILATVLGLGLVTTYANRSPALLPGSGGVVPDALAVCAGDCTGDGTVTVDEVVVLVGVALGTARVDVCPAGDPNGDESVTVDEILVAVQNALCGCSGSCVPRPTATPSSTPTRTAPPTASPTATFTPSPQPTLPTPGQVLFREAWEAGRVGVYQISEVRPTFFDGDTGPWFVGDSVSESCGTSRNSAALFLDGPTKRLRLTSAATSCGGHNVFVGPVRSDHTGPRELNIPLGTDVFFSFRVSADLDMSESCNAAFVRVFFDTFRSITYVVQRTPDWDRYLRACLDITFDEVILLDPTQPGQVRNLFADAGAVGIGRPGQIDSLEMSIEEVGTALFDDLVVFRAR